MFRKNSSKKQLKQKKDNSDFFMPLEEAEDESNGNQSFCLKKQKKIRSKIKKDRIYRKKNHGCWSAVQERKFSDFMKKKRSIFEDKELRRSCKIFKEMAESLVTRSSEQCRSHHQKYELKLHTFESIISYVESKIYELERPQPQQSDSEYEFMQVEGELWENNPVYMERPHRNSKPGNNEHSLNKAGSNKVYRQQRIQCEADQHENQKKEKKFITSAQPELLKVIEGQWQLSYKEDNVFTVQICFDNFI